MADKSKSEFKRFKTPPFVLSYPHIWEPQTGDFAGAKPKYGCQAIWTPKLFTDKDKKLWAEISAEIVKVVKEKFKVEGKTRIEIQNALREKHDSAKMGIRNGASRADQKGYGEGTLFASLTSTSAPGVIDLANNRIAPAEGNAEELYPGCVCRATITVYAYDKNGGKGYALGLGNLQKIKDGERLDSRVAAEDDFADDEVDAAWLDQEDGGETDEEIPF